MNRGIGSPSRVAPAPGAEPGTPSVSPPPEWLIVGLDLPDLEQARPLVRTLAGRVGALKIGPVLFTRAGPAAIDLVHEHGRPGVPRSEVVRHSQHRGGRFPRGRGARCVDGQRARGRRRAHAGRRSGGPGAGRATRHRAPPPAHRRNRPDQPGRRRPARHRRHRLRPGQVERLAALAERGGADGLVTSGHEAAGLRARWPQFNLVVPGVRPRWLTASGATPADDQHRIATPAATLAAGASHIAIARPIITHPDPAQAVHLTVQEVATGN